MKRVLAGCAIAWLTLPLSGAPAADAEAISNKVERFLAGIDYRTGTIPLGDKLATLQVPVEFSYVGPDDAAKILRLWGNPPTKEKPLGMLFPAGLRAESRSVWAVLINWSEDGYIKDDDAGKIDYQALMKKMQKGTEAENGDRIKQGYPAVKLIGWASQPRYDKAAHKLYWAKEIEFDANPEHTLNYDIRILGRRGVLVMSVIADISSLNMVEATAPQLLAMVDFNAGNQYTEFNPSKDKYAAYGIAALVAGGVAAKAGLFKGLLVALLAAKKFIIIGLVALGAFIKKIFATRKDKSQHPFG